MLIFAFWLLLLCSIYSYILYPIILLVIQKVNGVAGEKLVERGANSASRLSLIVTAHNEEIRIRKKIENALSLSYDPALLEIIIASDASEDETDNIVREYENKGILLVRPSERLGKENAQLSAIGIATGDILVFSDVATEMEKDALTKLALHFSDPGVGAVSSEDRFVSQSGEVAGEGAYVKYEMWLRQQESKLAGLIGLSGSFFAARKEICQEWDIHSPSDFNTALNCARLGRRSITAPDVLGFYEDLKDPAREYSRKVRTVIRGMTALARHPEALNPTKLGLFTFQVVSHKLMRWLVPWFLIAFFVISCLVSARGGIYLLAFIGQLGFYGVALAAHYSSGWRDIGPIKLVYFFVQVNIGIFDASCQFLAGKRMTTWKPSAR